jgi:hypothetical protein
MNKVTDCRWWYPSLQEDKWRHKENFSFENKSTVPTYTFRHSDIAPDLDLDPQYYGFLIQDWY